MAMDETGLEQAAIERAPGDVGWDVDMGRFKALVKMLRLGDTASLWGLPLPDPKKDGFDAAVEKVFRTFAEQRAPQPLLEAQGAEGGAGPPLQLQQQVPAGLPAPQLPAPPSSTTGEARVPLSPAATAAAQPPAQQPPTSVRQAGGHDVPAPAGSSTTAAPQPMEVEAPPAPAQNEELLVPLSALHGLGLDGLVSQLEGVLAAATLDEAMVGQLLNNLEGLKRSAQEMQKAGAPSPTAHRARAPAPPTHTTPPLPCHRPHGPAQARAGWSTRCAGSQGRLNRSKRAPTSCTRSGRRTGIQSTDAVCTRCAVCVCGVC
jgi:hypothetical protein